MLERNLAMKLAGALATSYPGRDVTERHANAWADEIERLKPHEAERVVELVRSRCVDPPSRAQVRQAIDEVQGRTMSPAFDPSLCVFADGVVCRNCGEIHGHLLPPTQIQHGVFHLRRLLAGDRTHLEASRRPEGCDCGFTSEADVGVVVQDFFA